MVLGRQYPLKGLFCKNLTNVRTEKSFRRKMVAENLNDECKLVDVQGPERYQS